MSVGRDISVFTFRRLGLKIPITAHLGEVFWGFAS